MNLLTATYTVGGGNFSLLIQRLKRKKVNVISVKPCGYKKILVTIDYKDRKKFFAILNNMWYNSTESYGGVLYPVVKLWRSAGILIGCVIFTIATVLSDNLIFGVSLTGDSEYFSSTVYDVLHECGIERFTRFDSVDLDELNKKMYESDYLIAFCSCKKRGNRLVIETVKAKDGTSFTDTSNTQMVSNVDGVVKDLTVYRGTSVVKVSDTVKAGDVLVDGYYVLGDQTYPTYVLATAVIESQFVYEYQTVDYSESVKAQAFAVAECMLNKDVTDSEIAVGDGKITVTLYYRSVIKCG